MAAVNPNGINIPLANGESILFINGKPAFILDSKRLPRNPQDSITLES